MLITYLKILKSYLKAAVKYPRRYPKTTAFWELIMLCSSDSWSASNPQNAAINRIIFPTPLGVVFTHNL